MNPCAAHNILAALAKRHSGDLFLAEVTTGPVRNAKQGDYVRLDGLAIKRTWANPEFVGYEVKSYRNDFLADTKWPRYRDYCHRLYFASPPGVIRKEELADDVGLVYFNPETRGLWTAKKALYRDIGFPPGEMLYHILISKLPSDHHPFFSDAREQLEAWIADKEDRRHLGGAVGTRLVRERDDAVKEAREAKQALESATVRLDGLRRQLKESGVSLMWGDTLPSDFRKSQGRAIPPAALSRAREIEATARSLAEMLAQAMSTGPDLLDEEVQP